MCRTERFKAGCNILQLRCLEECGAKCCRERVGTIWICAGINADQQIAFSSGASATIQSRDDQSTQLVLPLLLPN